MISLSGFGIRVREALSNELGSIPSSVIFGKSLRRIGVSSCLNVWQNSPVKSSGPGLLFVGRFLITLSISVLVSGLFIFFISSWFSLGNLYLFFIKYFILLILYPFSLFFFKISHQFYTHHCIPANPNRPIRNLYFFKNLSISSWLSILLAYTCF